MWIVLLISIIILLALIICSRSPSAEYLPAPKAIDRLDLPKVEPNKGDYKKLDVLMRENDQLRSYIRTMERKTNSDWMIREASKVAHFDTDQNSWIIPMNMLQNTPYGISFHKVLLKEQDKKIGIKDNKVAPVYTHATNVQKS